MTLRQRSQSAPILSFGFERSGTTLLSMLLGAHPNLAVPFSPTGLWYRYYRGLSAYNNLNLASDRKRLVQDLLDEERIKMWDVTLESESILERIQGSDGYGKIIEAFHACYAESCNKSAWVLHDIATIDEMHTANDLFTDAKFLHIVRDVRDVVLSHKRYQFGSSNSCEVALRWRDSVRTNIMMGKILGPARYHLLRFEDVVLNPESTLIGVCDFLGITFTTEMLNYSGEVSRKVPSAKRGLWPALGGKLDGKKVGRWTGSLKPYEIAAIHEICADLMGELGYQVEHERSGFTKEVYLVGSVLFRGGRLRRTWRRLRGKGSPVG